MQVKLTNRLAFRLIAMLSVALLPIGLIALVQTNNVVRQTKQLETSALLGRTLAAVEPQRDVMHGGFAAASVLGAATQPLLDNRAACSALMREFITVNPEYVLAMFVPPSGVSTCNSNDAAADLRQDRIYEAFQDTPKPRVMGHDEAPVTRESILVIAEPVIVDGAYRGFLWLSLPRANIRAADEAGDGVRPISLITFNQAGEVLLADGTNTDIAAMLPAGSALSAYTFRRAQSLPATNRAGKDRLFTVAPIIPGVVYAFSSWDAAISGRNQGVLSRATTTLFPIIMWAISLLVAYIAVHRLVIRHITTLRMDMLRFASGSREFSPDQLHPAPAELRQMEETFLTMAQTIAHDEAELEDGLHEKNVLLKEVHHRVKNNLQLIASIMNMEIRKAALPETRNTLRRVQDRVLGLATVHSNLYHTSSLASVRADTLLNEILKQTLTAALPPGGGVRVTIDIDRVELLPDQAVPLSLLTTEAATNAVKYIGRPADGSAPWVRIKLCQIGEDRISFEIANSTGAPLDRRDGRPDSSGLGNQLINAFATQLGGKVVVQEGDDQYRLSLEMAIMEFVPAAD